MGLPPTRGTPARVQSLCESKDWKTTSLKGGVVNNVSVKYRSPRHRGDRHEVAHDVWPDGGPDRVGRFSDGLEHYPEQHRRIGRFSEGLEQQRYDRQARRIGRFSDGLEQYPEQSRRIGHFSDGLEQYPDQPPVLVAEDLPGSATSEAA